MSDPWDEYQKAAEALPETNIYWPFYGAGLDNLGVNGRPLTEPIPSCGSDQLLVRVDALGICASDAKMVRLGNKYPLFFDRDFATQPGRLGHEAALTVIQVGEKWRQVFRPGQRLGIQADVYVNGRRVIVGVNIPGAMSRYLVIPNEVLEGDEGSYVFPVPPELTYVDVALLEPWACVEAAYTPRRRLAPKAGGVMWIKGQPGDQRTYQMSRPLNAARVVLSDVPRDFAAWVRTQPAEIVERNGARGAALVQEFTPGDGFDDVILLGPRRAQIVSEAAACLNKKGTLNVVADKPLDGPVAIDVGRLHYGPVAYVGCTGPDVARAYGPDRNRSDLRAGGVTCVFGAGGPMGRMHLQRALEMHNGPRAVIATDTVEARTAGLMKSFAPLAEAMQRELVVINVAEQPHQLQHEIARLAGSRRCDDIVMLVPSTRLIEQAAGYLADDGMLVLFAGVPLGEKSYLPLEGVFLGNVQYTGTSGSTVADEMVVLEKTIAGSLSPARSMAAVAGLMAIPEAVRAVTEGIFPGKVIVFPQLVNLPLLSLAEMEARLPDVFAALAHDGSWTKQAEQALFEHYLPH